MKKETFQTVQSLQLENSYSVVKSEANVILEVTVGINSEDYGWFEIYDIESGGEEWYAEGSLQFDGLELTGYDGVFSLSIPVAEKLREWGYQVDESCLG
jgi:hypothetical protein